MNINIKDLNRDAVRDVASLGESLIVFDDDSEPLVRILPMAVELKTRAPYFMHFPHDGAECFYTCWRHPKPGMQTEKVSA